MHITIAAIVPLFNGASYIESALRSILEQTVPPDEIIVIDDGSTDDGPVLVKRMAGSSNIRLLTKSNGGQSSARNFGVAQSSSTHIALLDQDDLWPANHLEILKRPFVCDASRELAFVYGNVDRIDASGRLINRNYLDSIPSPQPKKSRADCLAEDMHILPGATLISRRAFDKVGGFDERLSGYEDDDLFLRMFSEGLSSTYIAEIGVLRWRANPQSTSYSVRMAASRMVYFNKLIQTYPDEPRLNMYWSRDIIAPRFFHICFCEFIEGGRGGDTERTTRAWSDLNEVIRYMDKRTQRRFTRIKPLAWWMQQREFGGAARSLIRLVSRSALKTRKRGRTLSLT